MDAVILCGGLGTRLREAEPGRQKTMVEVGGRPFLDRVVGWAAGAGLRRFVLCAGYRSEEVRRHFAEGPNHAGLDFVVSEEDRPLGTAGALARCRALLRGKTALVVNGDSLCPLDLRAFAAFHAKRGGIASVAAIAPGDRTDGGFVAVGAGDRVLSFSEREPGPGRRLSAGIYLLEPEFWSFISPQGPASLEKDVFPKALGRGVYAFITDAPLRDIGTPERLAEARRQVSR